MRAPTYFMLVLSTAACGGNVSLGASSSSSAGSSGSGGATAASSTAAGPGSGGGGGAASYVPPAACNAAQGAPYTAPDALDAELHIVGRWLQCSGAYYKDSVGFTLHSDLTWSPLYWKDGAIVDGTGFDSGQSWVVESSGGGGWQVKLVFPDTGYVFGVLAIETTPPRISVDFDPEGASQFVLDTSDTSCTQSCAQAITDPCPDACQGGPSATKFDGFAECMASSCAMECNAGTCSPAGVPACADCIMQNCSAEFNDCANDL